MRLKTLLWLGSVLTLSQCPRARTTSSYMQWLRDTSPPALHPTSSGEAMATLPIGTLLSQIRKLDQEALEPSTASDLIQIFTLPIKSSNNVDTAEVSTFDSHSLGNLKLKDEEQKTLKQLRHILQTLLESITESNETDIDDTNENQHVYIIDINTTEGIQPTEMTSTVMAETSQDFQADTSTQVSTVSISIEPDLMSTEKVPQPNDTTEVSNEEIVNDVENVNQNTESIPTYSQEKGEKDTNTENNVDTSPEKADESTVDTGTSPEEQHTEVAEEETKATKRFLEIVRLLDGVVPDLDAYLDNPLQNHTDKEASEKAFAILAVLKSSLCISQENADIQENIDKLLQDEVKIIRLLTKKRN